MSTKPKAKYASNDTHGMTQAEVGAILGVSSQMVNHIEKKALAKLKRMLKRRAGAGDPRDILPD